MPDDPGDDLADIDGRPQLAATCRAMSKLLAMALACDQTRVFSMMFSGPVSTVRYPNTTAVGAMDFRLTDPISDPPGATDHLSTETLLRRSVLASVRANGASAGIAGGSSASANR